MRHERWELVVGSWFRVLKPDDLVSLGVKPDTQVVGIQFLIFSYLVFKVFFK